MAFMGCIIEATLFLSLQTCWVRLVLLWPLENLVRFHDSSGLSVLYVHSSINSVIENVHSIYWFQFNNLQRQTLYTNMKRLDSSLLVGPGGKQECLMWMGITDSSPNPYPLPFLFCGSISDFAGGQWSQVRMNETFLPKDGIMLSIVGADCKTDLFVGWSMSSLEDYPPGLSGCHSFDMNSDPPSHLQNLPLLASNYQVCFFPTWCFLGQDPLRNNPDWFSHCHLCTIRGNAATSLA